MKVIKRDGATVDFDRSKIVVAIQKANEAVESPYRISQHEIDDIADYVSRKDRPRLLVEDIQDMVEQQIMSLGKYELAKAYIIYRYIRSLLTFLCIDLTSNRCSIANVVYNFFIVVTNC